MLAAIESAGLPALRVAAVFFITINILGGIYVFRNRHRFFGRDPEVSGDYPAARKMRVEVVLIPWFFLTVVLIILLIRNWGG